MNRTLQRAKSEQTVYAVQDSSDPNYKGLKKCNNLGLIGKLKNSKGTKGLRLHNRKLEGTYSFLSDSKRCMGQHKRSCCIRTDKRLNKHT